MAICCFPCSHEFCNNIRHVMKCVTVEEVKESYDLTDNDTLGKLAFTAVQVAACFSSSFPHIFGDQKDALCLIPCAIDKV